MKNWADAFRRWARAAFENFREGCRDPDVVKTEKRAFRAGSRATISAMRERYTVYLECAERHLARVPTKAALDYRYAWLHGAYCLMFELGVPVESFPETPNQWFVRWSTTLGDATA